MKERNRQMMNVKDPLLALRCSGKKLWADEHADEYVSRLREGWPEPEGAAESAAASPSIP